MHPNLLLYVRLLYGQESRLIYEKVSRSPRHYRNPCYFEWVHPVINTTSPTFDNHHDTPTNYGDANGYYDTNSAKDTICI